MDKSGGRMRRREMLVGCGTWMMIGVLIMRKMINFKF